MNSPAYHWRKKYGFSGLKNILYLKSSYLDVIYQFGVSKVDRANDLLVWAWISIEGFVDVILTFLFIFFSIELDPVAMDEKQKILQN